MNDHYEAWLRDHLQTGREHARPSEACPPSDALCRLVLGELSKADAATIASHVATCAACAEGLLIARDLVAPAPPRRTSGVSVGAVAAIAAGLLLVVLGSPNRVEPLERPPHSGTPRGGESPLRPTSPSSMARDAFELSWSPAPEGARYDVVVLSETLEVVVQARDLDTPRWSVSADALDGVAPGATLLWRVTRRVRDETTTTSPTWTIELVP